MHAYHHPHHHATVSAASSPDSSQPGTPSSESSGQIEAAASSGNETVTVDSKSYSPASSPGSTVSGQQILLLPNVKHAPRHLRTGSPISSSGSSTPMQAGSPGQRHTSPARDTPTPPRLDVERKHAVNSPVQMLYDRRRVQSPLARAIAAQSPVMSLSEEEEDDYRGRGRSSPIAIPHNGSMKTERPDSFTRSPEHRGQSPDVTTSPDEGAAVHGMLKLKTGFSRQFSEDLETPTEIKDIVRMIDESMEKIEEEEDDLAAAQGPDSGHVSMPLTSACRVEPVTVSMPVQSQW